MSRNSRVVTWLVVAVALTLFSHAQSRAADSEVHPWWQHAVFYEIYPRSFADSNGDGIGDLNGIASKLDYLQAIWAWTRSGSRPAFPSPQVDFGYDVSDYENIDPMYGTLADFDRLAKRGQEARHPDHPGFRHEPHLRPAPWFIDSRSSRDYRQPRLVHLARRQGPEPAAQQLDVDFRRLGLAVDPKTSQYYYHYFYPQQPDLNWRNPAVEKAMFDVTRWWYKRGVAGFRLDAVDTLFEDPSCTTIPFCRARTSTGDPNDEESIQREAAGEFTTCSAGCARWPTSTTRC